MPVVSKMDVFLEKIRKGEKGIISDLNKTIKDGDIAP